MKAITSTLMLNYKLSKENIRLKKEIESLEARIRVLDIELCQYKYLRTQN